MPSGLSVMGACRGLGVGGSWLGCGLGRPVGCSSALGMWLWLQPPGFVGTFPPLATWALILIYWLVLTHDQFEDWCIVDVLNLFCLFLYNIHCKTNKFHVAIHLFTDWPQKMSTSCHIRSCDSINVFKEKCVKLIKKGYANIEHFTIS